jgi:hypothetical protein
MATYKPLQSIALTSATTSITFSGIDQNYTDLVLVASTTVATASGNLVMTFNGDTTSGLYSKTQIEGTGSTVISGRTTGANNIGLDSNMGSDTINPSIHIINLTNYSNTTGFKTILHRQSSFWSANPGTALRVGLWRNTNAITSITLTSTSVNFNAGSTFDLYGIKSGAPQALGGDVITTDGNYWYHTFRSTAAFTPQRSLSTELFIVAGGGAGGGTDGGGGGAGGVRYLAAQTLSTPTTITVGAGGTAAAAYSQGTNGINSSVGALSATGGGKGAGGSGPQTFGSAGGSGGGGAGNTSGGSNSYPGGAGNAGGYSPVEGFAGGIGKATESPRRGAGGGGAGGLGINGDSTSNGGVGINTISGTTLSVWVSATGAGVSGYFAGGGGGGGNGGTAGAGGTGGGGAGGIGIDGTAGTANSGGGGGGGGNDQGGGAGGSGIVIVRYPV